MRTNEDHYPLALPSGFELMPTGSENGVLALCRRHEGEVSALVVNSLTEAPDLGSLAFMAGEHEAEHHGGPAMPDEEADSTETPATGRSAESERDSLARRLAERFEETEHLRAEVERLRAVAWQIRDAMVGEHSRVSHFLDIENCKPCVEARDECDGSYSCDEAKAWQAAYSDALGCVIGPRPEQASTADRPNAGETA